MGKEDQWINCAVSPTNNDTYLTTRMESTKWDNMKKGSPQKIDERTEIPIQNKKNR